MEEKAKAAEAKVYQDMAETAGEKHEGKDEAEVGTPTKKKPKNRRTGTPKRTARKRATPKRKAQASPKKAKKRENEDGDGAPHEMTPRTKKKKTAQEPTCYS